MTLVIKLGKYIGIFLMFPTVFEEINDLALNKFLIQYKVK
jgi:hypothetical protein